MSRTFESDLSRKGIENLINELEDYKKEVGKKIEIAVKRLAEIGIEVARDNTGGYGKYISFSIKTESDKTGCTAILIATQTGKIKSQWKTKDGIKTTDVSPLLMAEFGAGFKAKNPKNVSSVGQGTFPEQTHAFDKEGWYYQDLNDVWHHSYGIEPKMPMYKASIEMLEKINTVITEVFNE